MEYHLRIAEAITEILENRFSILGYRFGIEAILGFIPWAGDIMTLILSFYLIWIAYQLRVPEEKIARMVQHVIFDFFLGLIPFIGDISDVFYKANTKNLRLIKQHAPRVTEAVVLS